MHELRFELLSIFKLLSTIIYSFCNVQIALNHTQNRVYHVDVMKVMLFVYTTYFIKVKNIKFSVLLEPPPLLKQNYFSLVTINAYRIHMWTYIYTHTHRYIHISVYILHTIKRHRYTYIYIYIHMNTQTYIFTY